MTRARVVALLAIAVLVLLLGVGTAAWWYLFGPNEVDAADLVPADTIFYATVPNAANLISGYQTSQLKQLVDSPNSAPLSDAVVKSVGQKNIDVLNAFLPNLSGQSFFAITHFDPDKPGQVGVIAGMRPKAGTDKFDAFIDKLKTTWPDFLKQGTTGTGTVEGVDYQWLKGPGGEDKLCVARVKGWIITTWGEASLQDWIERFRKKSITPSLSKNADYQKSIARVGKNPMTLLYVDCHAALALFQQYIAKTNPVQSDYFLKMLGGQGGLAIGSRFEDGQIVDRYSLLISKQTQTDTSVSLRPCSFETLKFTGPQTRLYHAAGVNFQQYWKALREQAILVPSDSFAPSVVNGLQQFTQNNGLDLQHNIIDALGDEVSLQIEWNDDSTYPEIGFFVKIAKPDDFKPVITALIESTRKQYMSSAVMTELNSNGQKLAALKFIQASPFSFTVTEEGPYFGVFTTETLAVRSFARDEAVGLPHINGFKNEIGDKRNGAAQIVYVDTPLLLDRGYRMALPYVSLLSMFNKDLAAFLQGKTLSPDLTWLAPIGPWSGVMYMDDSGLQGYSVSGIGNQGIFLTLGGSSSLFAARSMGVLPKWPGVTGAPAPAQASPASSPPPLASTNAPSATPPPPSDTPAPATTTTPAPDTAPTPATVPAIPDASMSPATNAPTPTPDANKPQ